MQKERRHNVILKLIAAEKIGGQEKLAELLKNEGYTVNQSSVSRDLDELGIIKIGGCYAAPSKSRNEIFGLQTVETAGDCLIVAKCGAGLASAVAVKIDAAQIAEIVGTIAGDDTIFIAVKSREYQKAVVRKIWIIFEKQN